MSQPKLAVSTLEVLESAPKTLRALLAGLPAAAVNEPGPEGWSPRDVVAHLASVQEPALFERVRMLAEEDDPVVPNIDEEETLRTYALRDSPVGEILNSFEKRRGQALTWIRTLSPESLGKMGRHAVAGRISAADQLNHFAYHDLAHIRQVCNLLIPRIDAERGAMGVAFPDEG